MTKNINIRLADVKTIQNGYKHNIFSIIIYNANPYKIQNLIKTGYTKRLLVKTFVYCIITCWKSKCRTMMYMNSLLLSYFYRNKALHSLHSITVFLTHEKLTQAFRWKTLNDILLFVFIGWSEDLLWTANRVGNDWPTTKRVNTPTSITELPKLKGTVLHFKTLQKMCIQKHILLLLTTKQYCVSSAEKPMPNLQASDL